MNILVMGQEYFIIIRH